MEFAYENNWALPCQVQLVSDHVKEKKEGKKLAGEVREAIKEVSQDEHVPVRVENQSLVSVANGSEASSYLVTSLSFPSDRSSASRKSKTVSEAITSSPGFSRNSSLAGLRPEERNEALQRYVL
jgi:hypothetical protein